MALRLTTVALAIALLTGCAGAPTRAQHSSIATTAPAVSAATVPADDNLNAVAWSQTAVEHDLIYLQTYRDAEARLLPAMQDTGWDALSKTDRVGAFIHLPPAVILDIDETVLDNSPYQARVIKSGGEFNEADWAAWCREAKARALPGALEFTRFAASHGVAVIYISNRARDLDEVTLRNLRQAGFPVSGPDALLGLGTVVDGCEQAGSEKGCRRQLVSRRYRVLMQFGDQLGDFLDVSTNTVAARRQTIAPYLRWIGTRWFVLPNPTYGSWEPALFNNDYGSPRDERRRQKLDALRYQ
ncbi:5'-nucleotidase, lipoprotein e(P4) family [Rhodanobacter sp. BL-MT-08]